MEPYCKVLLIQSNSILAKKRRKYWERKWFPLSLFRPDFLLYLRSFPGLVLSHQQCHGGGKDIHIAVGCCDTERSSTH